MREIRLRRHGHVLWIEETDTVILVKQGMGWIEKEVFGRGREWYEVGGGCK